MSASREARCESKKDLFANLLQVAVLNKLMPPGYRFELAEQNAVQEEYVPAPSAGPGRKKKVRIRGIGDGVGFYSLIC